MKNPVQEAYNILVALMDKNGADISDCWECIEEAVGFLGEVLDDDRLPSTYAEIDYGDREDAEAIEGMKWDDKNYQHYMER